MTEVISSDSGLGSDENSDREEWPSSLWNADANVRCLSDLENPRKVQQRTKRRKANRSLAFAKGISPLNNGDEEEENQDDEDEKSNAHSLMISNAKRAVKRLVDLLSDLRLSCGLQQPIITDTRAPFKINDKLTKKKSGREERMDNDWRNAHATAIIDEAFKRRHEDSDDDVEEREWTRLDGRKKLPRRAIKCFGSAPTTRKRGKSQASSSVWRYATCIFSALVILLTLALSAKWVNVRQPTTANRKPSVAVKNSIASRVEEKSAFLGAGLDVHAKFSKLRWRDDSKLLQFAIERETKQRHWASAYSRSLHIHVNSLLTESAISSTSNLSAPFASQAGPSSGASVVDPSLIDYEAIDVYWRRDIEQEKNPLYASIHPLQSSLATNVLPAEVEQFERDLQLLTEKSMQLNSEEQRDYENYSKSYYTDLYLDVGGKAADKENNHDGSVDVCPTSSRRSGCVAPAATRLQSLAHSEPLTSKTTGAGIAFRNWPPPTSTNLRGYSGAEKTLVIDRRLYEADGGESSSSALNVERSSDSVVLNDVSLADANTFESLTGDVTEFFDLNRRERDENDDRQGDNDTLLAQQPSSSAGDDDESLALPFENLFDEGFIDTNFAADGLTLNELMLEVMREDLFSTAPTEFLDESQPPTPSILRPPVADEVDRVRYESVGTPSSGINSATFASSPSHGSSQGDFSMQSAEFGGMESRFHNKLVPSGPMHFGGMHYNSESEVYVGDHDYYAQFSSETDYGQDQPSTPDKALRRGRRSKDEQLAVEYGLPASAEEITHMTHTQVQHILRNPQYTPAQKALVKKIRRRGRNKVAARKCRERRINPLSAGYDMPERSSRQPPPFDASAPSTSRQASAMYAASSTMMMRSVATLYEDEEYYDGYEDDEERFFTNYRRDWSPYPFDNQKLYSKSNR